MVMHKKQAAKIEALSGQGRFRVSTGVEAAWFGAKTVLVGRRPGRFYSLTGLATRIWALLAKGASERTILIQLRREVGAPAAQLELETAGVLRRLLEAGVIERRSARVDR